MATVLNVIYTYIRQTKTVIYLHIQFSTCNSILCEHLYSYKLHDLRVADHNVTDPITDKYRSK